VVPAGAKNSSVRMFCTHLVLTCDCSLILDLGSSLAETVPRPNHVRTEDPVPCESLCYSQSRKSRGAAGCASDNECPSSNTHHGLTPIYIYCFYILYLGAFNIENAPRPNLRARSEPTVPPRSSSSVFVPPARLRRSRPLPTEPFHFPAHAPLSPRTTQPLHISCNHIRPAVAITPDSSCNHCFV
jgi:hypothetical protein